MKKLLFSFLLVLLLIPNYLWAGMVIGGVSTLDDSYNGSQDANGWLCVTYSAAGQSFVSGGGVWDSAKVYLNKAGSPTGNATVSLYLVNAGVPTGSALATSDVLDVSTLTTSYVLTTFTVSGVNRILLTAGTTYFLIVTYTGGDCTNHRLHFSQDTTSPTHSGTSAYYDTSWHTDTPDYNFYIYVLK